MVFMGRSLIFFINLVLVLFFQGGFCDDSSRTSTLDSDVSYKVRLEKALQELLSDLDPIRFPFLPTLWINPRDQIDVSLSFTNISISGLLKELEVVNIEVPSPLPGRSKHLEIKLNVNQLLVFAGEYSAGGHINNLPFTGESYMKASFEDVGVTVGMECQRVKIYCIIRNTTTYEMDVRKPVVYFDNLNPGTDQGELVNTAISGLIPDIVDFLQFSLNGAWHEFIDGLVVDNLNSIMCEKDTEPSSNYHK